MRVLAVIGVIAVHAITLVDPTTSDVAGVALVVLHTSREIFFSLMALVLAYNYRDGILRAGQRVPSLLRFWRRRYVLVVVPYVVWSAIYFIANGLHLDPLSSALRNFAFDLLTGGARYHLYFLLVTMQLYLVFPLVMAFIRWTRGHHRLVLLAALAFQLLFAQAHHAAWTLPQPLAFWLANPDSLLPSYLLYIVTGALLAEHLQGALTVLRRWWPFAVLLAIAGVGLAIGVYAYQVRVEGQVATLAAEVFQPAVTIESLTVTVGLLTLGVGWEALQRPRWLRAVISDGANSSFGIYLAHPLILQAVVVLMTSIGVLKAVTNVRGSLQVGMATLVVTPLVLAVTWPLVLLLRHSPLSMPLTGRRWRRPAAPAPARRHFPLWPSLAGTSGAVLTALVVVVTQVAVDLPAQQALAIAGVPAPTRTAPPEATPSVIPTPPPGVTSAMVDVHSGGLDRTYQVLRPTHPTSAKLPVVVFLSGLDTTIYSEAERDRLEPYIQQGGLIVVYPVAEREEWDTGEDANSAGVDDMGFLTTVLQQAKQLPGADPDRVDLVGYSRGGKMAWQLECADPSLIDGLAIIAATPITPCATPGPPVSLLQIAGRTDPEIPYDTVVPQVQSWASKDVCSQSPAKSGQNPVVVTYRNCTENTRVVLVTYEGWGHDWPTEGQELPGQLIYQFVSAPAG